MTYDLISAGHDASTNEQRVVSDESVIERIVQEMKAAYELKLHEHPYANPFVDVPGPYLQEEIDMAFRRIRAEPKEYRKRQYGQLLSLYLNRANTQVIRWRHEGLSTAFEATTSKICIVEQPAERVGDKSHNCVFLFPEDTSSYRNWRLQGRDHLVFIPTERHSPEEHSRQISNSIFIRTPFSSDWGILKNQTNWILYPYDRDPYQLSQDTPLRTEGFSSYHASPDLARTLTEDIGEVYQNLLDDPHGAFAKYGSDGVRDFKNGLRGLLERNFP